MNDSDRRPYEMLVRVNQFGVDNAADFPALSIGAANFSQVAAAVDAVESMSAAQQSGFSEAAQQFEVKDTLREDLRDLMAAISRTAKSMEYSFDGIADKFKFQRNLPDADLLAKGRAFYLESEPYESQMEAYGLPSGFRDTLNDASTAFEGSFSITASATAEHVAATADISSLIRNAMINVRVLDGVVKNVFTNDPGKLAAWVSASHVEKPPKKATPPPTP